MAKSRTDRGRWSIGPGILLLLAAGCDGGHQPGPPRSIQSATIVMEVPPGWGTPQRPMVEFEHGKHTRVLEQEGCQECHPRDEKQRILPWFKLAKTPNDMDELMNAYHDACIGCHERRASEDKRAGPVDCGGCHVPHPVTLSTRQPMRFDFSLHARHIEATRDPGKNEEKCETCHHTYDEAAKKLEFKRGTEHNCWDCHGEKTVGKNLSRRFAAHLDCISCHLRKRDEKRKDQSVQGGPWLCQGCHSEDERAKIKKLDPVPRLKRNQPDLTWVKKGAGATAALVAFDHKFHETKATTCRECHHQTLRPCRDCHSLTGAPGAGKDDGGGVTLEQALHRNTSPFSCVGCHQKEAGRKECSACHHVLRHPPGEQACVACHAGPLLKIFQTGDPAAFDWKRLPRPEPAGFTLDPLPAKSDDFPEFVEVKALAKEYQPSKMPHLKIVTKLDKYVRDSKLGSWFHGKADTLCSGCHHHTPAGTRYPPCRTCHGGADHTTRDIPDLLGAYHRQCIGCHQQLQHKAQGCEDCHKKKTPKEDPK